MKHCAFCGGEIGENMRYCPYCGSENPQKEEEPLWDYEQPSEDAQEDDWLADVEDEDLPDINEDSDRTERAINAVKAVKPNSQSKVSGIFSIFCILGAILLCLGMWLGQDGKKETPAGAGLYFGCTVSEHGKTVKNAEDWAELSGDGTFRMRIDGKSTAGQWKLQGDAFLGYTEGREMEGTLSEGILSFRFANRRYLFALPEAVGRVTGEIGETSAASSAEENPYRRWEGDYFGSMVISEGTGAFAGSSGERYDVCGRIQLEDRDRGRLSLWNEKNKPGDRFCVADVTFAEGSTDVGKMFAEWGSFYEMEMGPGEWVVDPGKSPVSHFENMIYFRGTYVDMSSPESSFAYEIYLKPWGINWKDVEQENTDSRILPPGYYDWYLPLQKAGLQMPDHF